MQLLRSGRITSWSTCGVVVAGWMQVLGEAYVTAWDIRRPCYYPPPCSTPVTLRTSGLSTLLSWPKSGRYFFFKVRLTADAPTYNGRP